jgi:hypothetical protein
MLNYKRLLQGHYPHFKYSCWMHDCNASHSYAVKWYTVTSCIIDRGVKAGKPLPDPAPVYIYMYMRWNICGISTIYIYGNKKISHVVNMMWPVNMTKKGKKTRVGACMLPPVLTSTFPPELSESCCNINNQSQLCYGNRYVVACVSSFCCSYMCLVSVSQVSCDVAAKHQSCIKRCNLCATSPSDLWCESEVRKTFYICTMLLMYY